MAARIETGEKRIIRSYEPDLATETVNSSYFAGKRR